MGKLHVVAQWWPIGFLVMIGVVAVLDITDSLGPVYRWLHNHVSPEGWSALAAWFAVAVGIATVLVAGRYAKQQVEKAQDQVREAQAARLAQERQAQEALATQIRLANEALVAQAALNQKTLEHDTEQAQKIRKEQAQPNVVLYTELNPAVKQFTEIVLKNFGATPALDVKVTVTPPLKATPNLVSGDKLADVPIPDFPILAPGQEWRTGWDHSVSRREYQDKWRRLAETSESELTDSEKLEREYRLTRDSNAESPEQRLNEQYLPSRYTAIVSYKDSDGEQYSTEALLDSDLYRGTTWVDIKSIHDLTKTLDKHLKEQVNGLVAIHRRLAEFGTEHNGVWIYGSGDDAERDYRRRTAEESAEKSRRDRQKLDDEIARAQQRWRDSHSAQNPGDQLDESDQIHDQNGES